MMTVVLNFLKCVTKMVVSQILSLLLVLILSIKANITRGMSITVFYDADAPAVLIYPPRLQASVVASNNLNKM